MKYSNVLHRGLILLVCIGLAALLWRWLQPKRPSAPPRAPTASVTTAQVRRIDFPLTTETNGIVSALNQVEVRPQEAGLLAVVHIREGQFVRAGELLFSLDDQSARAELEGARAQLRKNQALAADAGQQLQRAEELYRQQYLARSEVDKLRAQLQSARAGLEADRAAVAAAQVRLGHYRIVAASAGRAGAIDVHPGGYVQPGGPPLVTLTRLDPVAVSFRLPQQYLPALLAGLNGGGLTVSVHLPERNQVQTGRLSFVDNAVDAASGTVQAKAEFANRDHLLWPGAYVDVAVEVGDVPQALVIPAAAIIQSTRGAIVYRVEHGRAQPQPVRLRHTAGSEAVVEGLAPGQTVVVDGKQNLKPGMAVSVPGSRSGPQKRAAAAGHGEPGATR